MSLAVRSTGHWAAGKVVGALNATELVSNIAVKSGICKPMVESEVATRCGWVKGLFGGGVLVLMGVASQLSEGRWSESSLSGFCDLRWEDIILYENERRDSQVAKSKKGAIQPSQHNDIII